MKKNITNKENNMNDVIIFINKMKTVFNLLPDEEIDIYNDIYNESTEKFVVWINQKYEYYKNLFK